MRNRAKDVDRERSPCKIRDSLLSQESSMKFAVSGKGGVGKTLLAAGLARTLAVKQKSVIAIDADPDTHLAGAVGIANTEKIVPLASMRDLIRERTEAGEEGYGVFFKLNPHVSDIPEKFFLTHKGVKVLTLGGIVKGGGGCHCPENVFLKTLLNHLILARDEVVIVDMEAGIEHLGRATVKGIDALIVVVEPGQQSIHTALRVRELARDIGIAKIFVVANKITEASQMELIKSGLTDMEIIGQIDYDSCIQASDMEGKSAYENCPRLVERIRNIEETLKKKLIA